MNWKVRIRNKIFWVCIIPEALLLVSNVLGLFGVVIDFAPLGEQLKGIVEIVFTILALLGIVVDPTTAGIGDSDLARTYERPKKDEFFE